MRVEDFNGDGGGCWGFCVRPVERKEVRGLPGYLASPPFSVLALAATDIWILQIQNCYYDHSF